MTKNQKEHTRDKKNFTEREITRSTYAYNMIENEDDSSIIIWNKGRTPQVHSGYDMRNTKNSGTVSKRN